MKRFLLYGLFPVAFLLLPAACPGQTRADADSVLFRKENTNTDFAWTVDSLMRLNLFSKAESLREQKVRRDQKPVSMDLANVPDMMFEYRFEEMNRQSVIRMDYNADVRRFILLFGKNRKEGFSRVLGLADMYFPLFEEYLEKYRLPLELKYLPVVESSLNPLARSNTDAIGLWQFKLNSSKMFGLEVNSVIDERMDPRKATEAACQYLAYLYSVFHDWQLALAAFNGGPGVVRNAIERSGGKTNFWAIRQYMPGQTQDYVPAFMAAAYMMQYGAQHDITPLSPDYDFWHTDSVMINYPIQFSQVSAIIAVPVDALRFLNPEYVAGFVPETGHPMILVLPSDKVLTFIRHENDVLGRKVQVIDYLMARKSSVSTENKTGNVYVVKNGDFLHKIAYEHECSIEDLRAWNHLKNDSLNPGQQIVIWLPKNIENSSGMPVNLQEKSNLPGKADTLLYEVKRGDTVYSIAAKFKGSNPESIMKSNQITDARSLKRGQQIRIPILK